MTSNRLNQMRWIPAPPALVNTASPDVAHFLAGLPAPDFSNTPLPRSLWAVVASKPDGTASVAGTAWVVSAEAFRRIRAHRF